MSQLKISRLVLGPVRTNCYLVYNGISKEAVIIDPADRGDRIIQTIEGLSLLPRAILLTHGHFDHIMAAEQLRDRYHIKIYVHEEELELTADPALNAAMDFGMSGSVTADEGLEDGQVLQLAGFRIKVLHTPGHTKGGVCYYFSEDGVLFSGDTLFAQSVGRTDLPTGSYSQLIRSIKEKLLVLPEETRVFPGHDEETTIGYELTHNPYLV